MAGTAAARVLPKAVTFVTGNAKKLEEVRAILGASIPFQSLKLDRTATVPTGKDAWAAARTFWVAPMPFPFNFMAIPFRSTVIETFD